MQIVSYPYGSEYSNVAEIYRLWNEYSCWYLTWWKEDKTLTEFDIWSLLNSAYNKYESACNKFESAYNKYWSAGSEYKSACKTA